MKKRINIAFFSLIGLIIFQAAWLVVDATGPDYFNSLSYKYFLPVFVPTTIVFIVVSAIVETWEEESL